jgi:hypothetical protein
MNDPVVEFLVENLDEEFEGAELVGTWEGYDVYSPVYSHVSTKGIPFFALADEDGIRLSEAGEYQDILRATYIQKRRSEDPDDPGFPDLSFLAEDPEWRSVGRETLKDGTVLRQIHEGYRAGRQGCDYIALLSCIRDSRFIVACRSDSLAKSLDAKRIEVGDVIESKRGGPVKPAVLEDGDGGRYMPIFSSEDQIPEGRYREYNVRFIQDFSDCVKMARTIGLDLVMDPFTGPFVIDATAADTALRIPTRIKPDA